MRRIDGVNGMLHSKMAIATVRNQLFENGLRDFFIS